MGPKHLRRRFWIEAALAGITGCLFVLTLLFQEWIEVVFGVEPDGGSGTIEWLASCGFLLVTIATIIVARVEYSPLSRERLRQAIVTGVSAMVVLSSVALALRVGEVH